MQNVNEKPLKIFLNSNHVIETYSVTVPSNKCFSLHSFKQQLANQIHELYLTTFTVKWRNSDGVEMEMSCDEDFDDVFPRVAVVYVYLTQTVFPSKEVEETVKVEEGGLKQMLQYLPNFLASFPTTKNSERLSELLKEVVDILDSDGVVANAEILDFVEQSASALEASSDNQ